MSDLRITTSEGGSGEKPTGGGGFVTTAHITPLSVTVLPCVAARNTLAIGIYGLTTFRSSPLTLDIPILNSSLRPWCMHVSRTTPAILAQSWNSIMGLSARGLRISRNAHEAD